MEGFLMSFVTKYEELYGNKLTVYNVGEESYFPKLNLDDFVI